MADSPDCVLHGIIDLSFDEYWIAEDCSCTQDKGKNMATYGERLVRMDFGHSIHP